MKHFFKRMIPKSMVPIAQRTFWRLRFLGGDFSKSKHGHLDVLNCLVSYNKYGGYCVPKSSRHRPAAQRILSGRVYEPGSIQFMASHCRDGDVVHAGTYFGDFLPALSEGVAPGSKVWAFEPNRENVRCARITLEINAIENVVLTNAGLGAETGQLLIQTVDEGGRSLGGASRIVAGASHETSEAVPVQMVTVDDIVDSDRNVSIIQLDVEGYEKEALTGALETIQRCLPILILEVLPNSTLSNSDWFAETVLSLGYRKTHDLHGNSVFSCEPQH